MTTPPGYPPYQPPQGPAYPPPQQGYPQPPAPVTPAPVAPLPPTLPPVAAANSRSFAITVTILVVALALCGGGGVGAYFLVTRLGGGGQATATAATVGFLTAVYKDKDAVKASKFVCSAARDRTELDRKINELRSLEQRYPRDPQFTWDDPKVETENRRSAKLRVTVNFSAGEARVAEQRLRITAVNDGGWFVCDVESIR